MKNTAFIAIIFLSAILFSCTRSVDTSHVEVKIPDFNGTTATNAGLFPLPAQNLQPLSESPTVVSALTSYSNLWSQVDSTGLTGQQQLNCFFVTASTPDLDTAKCTAGGQTATTVFSFATMSTPQLNGGTVYFDVPSGDNRVFRVLGLHADTNLDCYSLGTTSIVYRNLSHPYILATSAPQKISGTTATVDLQMQDLNLAQAVDSCEWPTGASLASTPLTPDHYETKIDTGIFGGNYAASRCLPIKFSLKDQTGAFSILATSSIKSDAISLATSTDTTTAVSSYPTALDCTNNANASLTFSNANQFETTRWIAGSSLPAIKLTNTTTSSLSRNVEDHSIVATAAVSGTVVPAAQVGEFIYNGSCVPVSFVPRALNWSTSYDFSTAGSNSSLQITLPADGSPSVAFYANPDCSSGGLPADATLTSATRLDFSTSGSARSVRTVYIKYSGFTAGQIVKHTFTFSSTPTGSHSSSFESRVLPFDSSYIHNPVALKVTGPTWFVPGAASSSYCLGPFKVATVDDNGVEIAQPLVDYTLDTSFFNNVLAFYGNVSSTAPCGGTLLPAGYDAFSLGKTSKKGSELFYLKVLPGATGYDNTQYIYVNASNISGYPVLYRGHLPLILNADSLSVESPASPLMCTGTGCILKLFNPNL